MKKLFFILICFSVVFILSCGGGSGSSGDACESNLDCKVGYVCSGGSCVSESSSEDGSGDGDSSELPDDNNGSEDGKSDNDGNSSTDDSDDWVSPDDPSSNGTCEPGKKQKCGYQGPEGTEDVGPCKAAVRTCKEDGTWGKCEGAVEPVIESESLCNNGIDDDCNGFTDELDDNCKFTPVENEDEDEEEDDSDVAHCDTSCPTMINLEEDNGCLKDENGNPKNVNEYTEGLCNGQDDDCDGKIDEGCPCTPGTTQACFSGKPKQRGVGTCHDGIQTCKSTQMRAVQGDWGDSKCLDEILPKKDLCDNADNNCNGCADEGLCCKPPIDCSFDIGTALPFADKIIDGTKIYDASHQFNDTDTATWEWSLSQGPCDIVLGNVNSYIKAAKTQGELGDFAESDRKTVVSGVGLSQFKVKFRLSGNYKLHLKVTRQNGEVHECEWILDVVSDGLRVELCWDKTGSQGSGGRDIDLYLGKNDISTSWSDSKTCYYGSCKGDPSSTSYNWNSNLGGWGYGETTNYNKQGVLTEKMKNPRLDMDNLHTKGEPENINIDNPGDGDVFRVLVNYYEVSYTGVVHPVVNIYCGGTRKATFGGEPSDDGSSFVYNTTNFDSRNDSWKVVEIQWSGNYSSNECVLTPHGEIIQGSFPSSYSNW